MESKDSQMETLGQISEDRAEYFIYIVDSSLAENDRRQMLRAVELASQQLCQKLLRDYLWHRESFSLQRRQQNGVSFLYGNTIVTDCVEDEWLIVYVLLELSKQFKSAWIRITDTDGEFLLVEAASVIPNWLNPEIADNRIWINQGRLLIIPRISSSKGETATLEAHLTRSQALRSIEAGPQSLLHLTAVEEEAFYRVRKYPEQITRNLHCTQAILPRELALILHKKPAYIRPAIEAFCLRDRVTQTGMQANRMEGLIFPPNDLVPCLVKFTRVGFAQIKAQQPQTPSLRRQHTTAMHGNEVNAAWAEVGMKVTLGFEVLLSDVKKRDLKAVREIKLILEDLRSGEEPLPSNDEISGWGTSEDDETWLDIDWKDFENELSGGGKQSEGKGFGDSDAHENLKRLVSRFEEFLEDDSAGLEDFELSEGDEDSNLDDGTSDSNEVAHSDDEDANGREDELTSHIRQILGMSAEAMHELMNSDPRSGPNNDHISGLSNKSYEKEKG